VAGLPLLRWRGPEALDALMETQGAVLFNPPTVEDKGLGVVDGEQVGAKRCYDPLGLLNPGKLHGWGSLSPPTREVPSSQGRPWSRRPSRDAALQHRGRAHAPQPDRAGPH